MLCTHYHEVLTGARYTEGLLGLHFEGAGAVEGPETTAMGSYRGRWGRWKLRCKKGDPITSSLCGRVNETKRGTKEVTRREEQSGGARQEEPEA